MAASGVCPRCDYQGQGLTYFSRGLHVAGVAALAIFTLPFAFGAAGFIYWGLRRDHLVCPRCGLSWGRAGELALAPSRASRSTPPVSVPAGAESARRTWSVLLVLVSLLLLVVGFANGDVGTVVAGAVAGGGGAFLHRAANAARDRRRQALIALLQTQVVRLAREKGGELTVTETAAALDWPIRRAEKVLRSLDDGVRVDSAVTDEGIIVYQFRELLLGRDSRGTANG